MIPHPGQALADLATKLASAIAPETSSAYAMANTGMISLLMLALARDSERAVANRMDDVHDLKALFARAAERGAHPDGADARTAFASQTPASLRLADVDALHARGMRLLIELHAWAEQADAGLDRDIWDLLAHHAERNDLDAPSP